MHVLMVNPNERDARGRFLPAHGKKKPHYRKNAKKAHPAAKAKRAAKGKRGRVIKGPTGTVGHVIVVDRGARDGLKAAPKGAYTVNPKKKSHKKSAKHHAKSKMHRHYRRNPKGLGGIMPFMKDTMLPALCFPGGALANDVVYGFLPLPATLKTGNGAILGKLGTAVVLGLAGSFFMPRRIASLVAGGMIGGVVYETGKGFLQTQFPNLPLAGISEYPAMTYEAGPGMGAAPPSYLGGQAPSYLGAYAESGPVAGYASAERIPRY